MLKLSCHILPVLWNLKAAVGHSPSVSKVTKHHGSIYLQQKVLWLDISVHHISRVDEV